MIRLFFLLLGVFTLSGCAAVAIQAVTAAGLFAAGGALTEIETRDKAERCYKVATLAEKEKVSKAELDRRLTLAHC